MQVDREFLCGEELQNRRPIIAAFRVSLSVVWKQMTRAAALRDTEFARVTFSHAKAGTTIATEVRPHLLLQRLNTSRAL